MCRLIVTILVAVAILVGCGYQQRTTQPDKESFISFTGNWKGTVVHIDNKPPFELGKTDETADPDSPTGPPTLIYRISPGNHEIKIFRDDRLLVNRVIFLSNQQTMEVRIP